MNTKISVLLCTYNGKDFLERCLDSILGQSYKNFEVLCIDGGSKDNSLEIIREYMRKDKRIKLIINKNRLPEGHGNGKWLGFRKSKGDIIGIIDQDNVLQRRDLFREVVNLSGADNNSLGILGGVKHDKKDPPIVRYVSLFGTDSFFAYRSMDFLRSLMKNRAKKGQFYLKEDNMPLTGGNCFFYMKKDLKKIGGYDQDVLNIRRLIRNSKNKLIIINDATKHYAEKDLLSLAKKKFMWGGKYFGKSKTEKFNYLPGTKKELFAFSKNLIFNIAILPNFAYAVRIYLNSKDLVSFAFPFMAFFNTLAYGINFIRGKLAIF